MKYLLDTNALLYMFGAPSELSARARRACRWPRHSHRRVAPYAVRRLGLSDLLHHGALGVCLRTVDGEGTRLSRLETPSAGVAFRVGRDRRRLFALLVASRLRRIAGVSRPEHRLQHTALLHLLFGLAMNLRLVRYDAPQDIRGVVSDSVRKHWAFVVKAHASAHP